MEWSKKRKILYAVTAVGLLILLSAYPIYKVVYPVPTCLDKKQNGDEVGVDCGGGCALYCHSQVKNPRVVWAKAFLVSTGLYDVGVYIENPNRSAGIKSARYNIRIFDLGGQMLAEREGAIEIAPSSTTLIFEGNFALNTNPEKIEIEFNKEDTANFVKASVVPSVIAIKNQSLKNTYTKPRFDAALLNTDLVNNVDRVELGAIIYDAARNPIAISRTYVDSIPKGSEHPVFFTWPNRFTKNPKGGMCSTPVDTILVFDRSGSMDVGRQNPPEPLTTAKKAANEYVDTANLADKVGLVSFATTASNPIDSELSIDHAKTTDAVSSIAIEKGSLQYTNLGDALRSALEELSGKRHTKNAKRVIIALTDGIANRPIDPLSPNNTKYAEDYAVSQADAIRNSGVLLYVISLGKDLNDVLLRERIATDPSRYFNAPTAEDLRGIYKDIAEGVCKVENFLTEVVVTPRAVFMDGI